MEESGQQFLLRLRRVSCDSGKKTIARKMAFIPSLVSRAAESPVFVN